MDVLSSTPLCPSEQRGKCDIARLPAGRSPSSNSTPVRPNVAALPGNHNDPRGSPFQRAAFTVPRAANAAETRTSDAPDSRRMRHILSRRFTHGAERSVGSWLRGQIAKNNIRSGIYCRTQTRTRRPPGRCGGGSPQPANGGPAPHGPGSRGGERCWRNTPERRCRPRCCRAEDARSSSDHPTRVGRDDHSTGWHGETSYSLVWTTASRSKDAYSAMRLRAISSHQAALMKPISVGE